MQHGTNETLGAGERRLSRSLSGRGTARTQESVRGLRKRGARSRRSVRKPRSPPIPGQPAWPLCEDE